MAGPIKVPSENDVIPPAEETLDFDNDNLRGEQNQYYFFLEGLISVILEYLSLFLITLLYIFKKRTTLLFGK